jgi:hypothetical protein
MGNGSDTIRRSIAPNSRRVKWLPFSTLVADASDAGVLEVAPQISC